jgi:hypothetical protein
MREQRLHGRRPEPGRLANRVADADDARGDQRKRKFVKGFRDVISVVELGALAGVLSAFAQVAGLVRGWLVCGHAGAHPGLVWPGVRVQQCARVRGPGLLRST